MISLLFISTMNSNAWGGSEELWYKTALLAIRTGHKVGVIVYRWKDKRKYIEILREAGCIVYELQNIDEIKPNTFQKFFSNTFYRLLQWISVRSISLKDYDTVIVNQGGFRDIVKGPFKHLYRQHSNIILIFHNYLEHYKFKKRRATTLIKWLNHTSCNFFAAGRIIEVLEQQLQTVIPHSQILYNPITFEAPEQVTTYPPLYNNQYNFAIIGYLDVGRKAQDQVIKTLISDKWKKRNWVLNIYGDGADKLLLEDLVKSNGLSEKVFLRGHIANVKDVLANSHILLQLTRQDAMPITVIEAMSIGRPLVVSRIGDMPVWVKQGENGFIADDTSLTKIDEALESAWQQREVWKQMGEVSYAFFSEKFPEKPELHFLNKIISSNVNTDK
jgi:glycosyltransferase involved in cell wall biosynthesis